jgi:hypothetical protein
MSYPRAVPTEEMRRSERVLVAVLVALVGCETSGDGVATGTAPSAPRADAAPPQLTQEQVITALAAEAGRLEKRVDLARPGRDRLVAAQDAVAAWQRWAEVSGKKPPASARRVARIAAKEAKAAAREEQRESRAVAPAAPARECCKVCTTGCPCGDSCIACTRTCRKGPGCAC